MVSTTTLGMEIGCSDHRDTSSWRPHQPRERRLVACENGRCNRRYAVALPPIGASQRCVFLECSFESESERFLGDAQVFGVICPSANWAGTGMRAQRWINSAAPFVRTELVAV